METGDGLLRMARVLLVHRAISIYLTTLNIFTHFKLRFFCLFILITIKTACLSFSIGLFSCFIFFSSPFPLNSLAASSKLCFIFWRTFFNSCEISNLIFLNSSFFSRKCNYPSTFWYWLNFNFIFWHAMNIFGAAFYFIYFFSVVLLYRSRTYLFVI